MFYFERIKPLLDGANMKEHPLEKAIGLAKSSIYNWNNQKNKISIDSLIKIATYFGVSTDYLLGMDNSLNPSAQEDLSRNVDVRACAYNGAFDDDKMSKLIASEKVNLCSTYEKLHRDNQIKLLDYSRELLDDEFGSDKK